MFSCKKGVEVPDVSRIVGLKDTSNLCRVPVNITLQNCSQLKLKVGGCGSV